MSYEEYEKLDETTIFIRKLSDVSISLERFKNQYEFTVHKKGIIEQRITDIAKKLENNVKNVDTDFEKAIKDFVEFPKIKKILYDIKEKSDNTHSTYKELKDGHEEIVSMNDDLFILYLGKSIESASEALDAYVSKLNESEAKVRSLEAEKNKLKYELENISDLKMAEAKVKVLEEDMGLTEEVENGIEQEV